eukprot:1243843-Alexandrium_andersonii.AAC.1
MCIRDREVTAASAAPCSGKYPLGVPSRPSRNPRFVVRNGARLLAEVCSGLCRWFAAVRSGFLRLH